jgi:outer membrane usher protein FimD/PapC
MAALAGLCLASQSYGHHAFSAVYDVDQVLEVTGVVTEVEWTNPHVRFYVEVKDANGSATNWDFELQSVNTLTRAGWTRHALQVGDVVTVVGYRARNGSNRANARGSVTKADGTTLFAGDAAANEQ